MTARGPIVLGLDTATLTESAAVVIGDDVVARGDVVTTTHSDRLLPLCAEVLARAGVAAGALDAIAVGAGPGSFTGLRIGMATAKGLAFALGKPLWAVSSLAALAADALDAGAAPLVIAALDARRGELYCGAYRRDGARVVAAAAERVLPPEELAAAIAAVRAPGEPVAVVGDAIEVHELAARALGDGVRVASEARTTPPAAWVARLALAGERVDALVDGAPAYVRPSEAEVKYPGGVPGALRRR